MNSINTNFAALTALQSLNQTNRDMLTTQNRISTGLRIGEASDGAAYWSMATTMKSDNKALSAVSDALGLGKATVDVSYTALESAIDVTTEIKAKLVAAREPGVDREKVQTEIDALQDQLRSVAKSASFTGENWLSVDSSGSYSATKSIVSSFTRDGSTVSVGTISVDVESMFLFDNNATPPAADARGILGSGRDATTGEVSATGTIIVASATGAGEMSIASATDAEIDQFIQAVDMSISEMTSAATKLGAVKARVDLQKDFVSALMDSIDRGVSSLVDADMNKESTRLQALQVQQQLGIQAMSIANQSSQNILALFR